MSISLKRKPTKKLNEEGTEEFPEEELEDEEEEEKSSAKKSSRTAAGKSPGAATSSTVFDIGKMKKVSVSNYKDSTLVDIREYYTDKKSGEEKPGKKGISLTLDQWNALKEQVTAYYT